MHAAAAGLCSIKKPENHKARFNTEKYRSPVSLNVNNNIIVLNYRSVNAVNDVVFWT